MKMIAERMLSVGDQIIVPIIRSLACPIPSCKRMAMAVRRIGRQEVHSGIRDWK
jgi:hypothetical protein